MWTLLRLFLLASFLLFLSTLHEGYIIEEFWKSFQPGNWGGDLA
jgi:hypothetical protein